jgi:hypothetical protein
MKNHSLIIDEQLLQSIIKKRRFNISLYDYFIYMMLCTFCVVIFYMIVSIVIEDNKSVFIKASIIFLLSMGLIYYLFGLGRSFINTFYFKKIKTDLTEKASVEKIIKLLMDRNTSGVQSSNIPNFITCFEYYSPNKSIIETTIIALDKYLLINSRNRNTTIVSLHRSEIASFIDKYFNTSRQNL